MKKQNLLILETNIDDMNPQIYDYLIEKGLKLGAKDIWLENIQMKKNRPAIKLSILTEPVQEKKFLNFIFLETTSVGVRVYPVKRYALARKTIKQSTAYGPIRFKQVLINKFEKKSKPEYEECKKLALRQGIPLREILEKACYQNPPRSL